MKKTVKKTVTLCDACKCEVDYAIKCLKCGIEFCYACQSKRGATYHAFVYCSGSGDGYYCHTCDKGLKLSGEDKLHSAYQNILEVRNYIASREEEMKRMKEKVESEIQTLL